MPPPPPPPPPLSLTPPPPPGSSSPPLRSSSPPLMPPYDAVELPPPPPLPRDRSHLSRISSSPPLMPPYDTIGLPPPPPLPRDCSHLTRISSSPPLPPSSRALPKAPALRGRPAAWRAEWEAGLPTVVLALDSPSAPSPTRQTRRRLSVEQLAPAPRGSPTTRRICADAAGEDLASVPLDLLPPKKRPVRYHPYRAASPIQEISSHGRGGGFGNRPVPLTVERDGDGPDNLPVPINMEGDGDSEGIGNPLVPPTVEGDGDGFGNRLVPPTVEGGGGGEGLGNRLVPRIVEAGGGDSAVRGDARQMDRDDKGLPAVLRRLRVSQPALVLTKRLTPSDSSRINARLILPNCLVRASPLLSMMSAVERDLVSAPGGLPVQAFDRLGRLYRMILKRDHSANTYRLMGEWTLFLSQHRRIRDGDDVEVFAFRPPDWQGELGLALVHRRSTGAATTTANGVDWGGPEGYEADGLPLLDVNPVRQEWLQRRRGRLSGNHL